MKLIYCKLSTGEELIGSTFSDMVKDEYINIEDPVIVKVALTENNTYFSYFTRFMPHSADSLFTFHYRDIITYTSPDEELIKNYNTYMEEFEEMKKEDEQRLSDLMKGIFDDTNGSVH